LRIVDADFLRVIAMKRLVDGVKRFCVRRSIRKDVVTSLDSKKAKTLVVPRRVPESNLEVMLYLWKILQGVRTF